MASLGLSELRFYWWEAKIDLGKDLSFDDNKPFALAVLTKDQLTQYDVIWQQLNAKIGPFFSNCLSIILIQWFLKTIHIRHFWRDCVDSTQKPASLLIPVTSSSWRGCPTYGRDVVSYCYLRLCNLCRPPWLTSKGVLCNVCSLACLVWSLLRELCLSLAYHNQ